MFLVLKPLLELLEREKKITTNFSLMETVEGSVERRQNENFSVDFMLVENSGHALIADKDSLKVFTSISLVIIIIPSNGSCATAFAKESSAILICNTYEAMHLLQFSH